MTLERLITGSGERALWCEVLNLAISDALKGPKIDKMGAQQRQEAHAAAIAYVTTPSRDLALVCGLAGVDMDVVIERVSRQVVSSPQKHFASWLAKLSRDV